MSFINNRVNNSAAYINKLRVLRALNLRTLVARLGRCVYSASALAFSAGWHFCAAALLLMPRHSLAVMPQLFQPSLALSPAYEKYRVVIFTKSIPNRLGKSL